MVALVSLGDKLIAGMDDRQDGAITPEDYVGYQADWPCNQPHKNPEITGQAAFVGIYPHPHRKANPKRGNRQKADDYPEID